MNHAEPTEAVRRAAAAIERARHTLTHPNAAALEDSLADLEQARNALEKLTGAGRIPTPLSAEADSRALLEMRTSLRRLRAHLELADGFYGGWLRVRNTLAGGYTQEGTPAAPGTERRVLAEG